MSMKGIDISAKKASPSDGIAGFMLAQWGVKEPSVKCDIWQYTSSRR